MNPFDSSAFESLFNFHPYFDSLVIISSANNEINYAASEIYAQARAIAEAAVIYNPHEGYPYYGYNEVWINQKIPQIIQNQLIMNLPVDIRAGIMRNNTWAQCFQAQDKMIDAINREKIFWNIKTYHDAYARSVEQTYGINRYGNT